MSHTYTRLLCHFVFSTKERASCIGEKLRPRLHAHLGGIIRQLDGTALVVGGAADHVHLLARLPAAMAVADAMRTLKANSSGWVNEQYRL